MESQPQNPEFRNNPENFHPCKLAATCVFQQCGILTSADSDEPVQPLFKLRNSKLCSVSSLTIKAYSPGRVGQTVTCLATDASLTADPGVESSIPGRSNTFVEIDHEIISTVILFPSAESFKKGRCQLQAKVCAQSTGKLLVQACQEKCG